MTPRETALPLSAVLAHRETDGCTARPGDGAPSLSTAGRGRRDRTRGRSARERSPSVPLGRSLAGSYRPASGRWPWRRPARSTASGCFLSAGPSTRPRAEVDVARPDLPSVMPAVGWHTSAGLDLRQRAGSAALAVPATVTPPAMVLTAATAVAAIVLVLFTPCPRSTAPQSSPAGHVKSARPSSKPAATSVPSRQGHAARCPSGYSSSCSGHRR